MPIPPHSQGRLVAIVVTYNRLHQLKVTIDRLLASPESELAQLIVVDNASTDGTADWLATCTDPRLIPLTAERNEGGAGGFVRGMTAAMAASTPDWLVLMDDDGRPDAGTLARFHSLDLSDWDALAAAVFLPDGAICDMNRPSRNPFARPAVFLRTLLRLGGREGFHLSPADYAQSVPRPIDITSFVGFFLRADLVRRFGYPDPRLFVYAEDGLYTLGLSKAGARIAFHPALRFEHDLSTFSGAAGGFNPLWKVYYYHRNLLLLYRAAAGPLLWPLLVMLVPKWILKARRHPGERARYLCLLGQAIRDGLGRRLTRSHDEVLALCRKD